MKQQLLHKLAGCPQLQHNLQPHQFADLCRQLKRSDEVLDTQAAQELLDLFCHFYWQLDELQKSCFEDVCSIWLNASRAAWIKIIPQLMSKSKVCNNLVFLAQMLIEELTLAERKTLDNVYMPYWTQDDEYTSITVEEYAYRQAKGLKCWVYKYPQMKNGVVTKDYRRPSCVNDFKCFEAMLQVSYLSEQKTYFYLSGLN
ncbi:MAG: hypothetical protein IJ529_03020 [Alphaproteobacteria bacterium]|nr:hypothetical protein [Alphaproteobacteria bacterium]